LDQTSRKNEAEQNVDEPHSGIKSYIAKYGPTAGMVVLICYLILLGIGVFAEVFKIQSILDWWIWSPPGKFK
jgi:hypothetical protein